MWGWRYGKGPPAPVSPLCASPEWLRSQPHLHLFNHLKQICVLQERRRREMVSLQRGPADPAEPPRRSCTQPSHPGPPSSDQTTWTYQPEAQAPRGSLLDSVPLPKGGGWCLRQRDVTFGERHISFMSLQGTRINPWTPKKSPRSQPQRGPQLGPSEGSVVLPTSLGRGSHLPISSTRGAIGKKDAGISHWSNTRV